MLEKSISADHKKSFGALLTFISQAFDYLSHERLLAKLYAYGFSIPVLRLVYRYLKNKKQSTKIYSPCSCWKKFLSGVPQGSILGPFLTYFYVTYFK